MGIRRGADDSMHIIVDGEDMGPAATGIAKVDPRLALDPGGGVMVFHSSPTSGSCVPPERVGCVGSIRASAECVYCQFHKARGARRHPASFPQLGHRK